MDSTVKTLTDQDILSIRSQKKPKVLSDSDVMSYKDIQNIPGEIRQNRPVENILPSAGQMVGG